MIRRNTAGIALVRTKDGRAWVSVDSVVGLMDQMADDLKGGPAEKSLRLLADGFRAMKRNGESNG